MFNPQDWISQLSLSGAGVPVLESCPSSVCAGILQKLGFNTGQGMPQPQDRWTLLCGWGKQAKAKLPSFLSLSVGSYQGVWTEEDWFSTSQDPELVWVPLR